MGGGIPEFRFENIQKALIYILKHFKLGGKPGKLLAAKVKKKQAKETVLAI